MFNTGLDDQDQLFRLLAIHTSVDLYSFREDTSPWWCVRVSQKYSHCWQSRVYFCHEENLCWKGHNSYLFFLIFRSIENNASMPQKILVKSYLRGWSPNNNSSQYWSIKCVHQIYPFYSFLIHTCVWYDFSIYKNCTLVMRSSLLLSQKDTIL